VASRTRQFGLGGVLFLLGFLGAAALLQERLLERELPGRREALEALVARRAAAVRDLGRATRALEDELARVRNEAAADSGELRSLIAEVDRLSAVGGLEALRGPGLVLTVSDSRHAPVTREEARDFRIQDVDLQALLNAVWRAGAEAVAVNGRRVVATTAVRQAGDRILVNYAPVASPYRLVVIGDAPSLARRVARSEAARRFQVWGEVYGLGFDLRTGTDLHVPALGPPPNLDYASPERR